ncbi:MAG TPA: glycosyltransferase family 4 protein, partial [Agriterribacter sp.]|nr:glycosyltransferase family 4 protein [Agriterribacter sp.]
APKASAIVAVSEKDMHTYTTVFDVKHIFHLPVFIPWTEVLSQKGRGTYCLYHGNLSVSENEQAAIWLIENVFHNLTIPFIIAGKNPSHTLKEAVYSHTHIRIVENPSQTHMQQLIQDAQINLLPSFNMTGIKLKLLHAVFCGRHCIANNDMVDGTGMETACYVATGGKDFLDAVQRFFYEPFTKEQIELRTALLDRYFNNSRHADQLADYIWG